MVKKSGLFALSVLLLSSGIAQAGRPRGGAVVSPFGTLYNTNSPEWKASGGNMMMYQQIMEQKLEWQQQRQMLKMQQQMSKIQKGSVGAGGSSVGRNASRFSGNVTKAKKKRRTYVPTGNSFKEESAKEKAGAGSTDKNTATGAASSDAKKTPKSKSGSAETSTP